VRLPRSFSDATLIVVGTLILSFSFMFLLSTNIILIYFAAAAFGIGNGLMWPSFLSLLSKLAGKERQGAVQGFSSSAGSLASIIGLILGGILYDSIGILTFFVPAIVFFIMFFLTMRCMSYTVNKHEA